MWRYDLPVDAELTGILAAGEAVVVGVRSENVYKTFALDSASGRVRWQYGDGAGTMVAEQGTIFYGTSSGAVVARVLANGNLRWARSGVCDVPNFRSPVGGVDVAIKHGADLIIGCNGGRVVRIDAASGHVRARADQFDVNQVSSIVWLSPCAYGVTGWSSGATLVDSTEILGCKLLNQIVPIRRDTMLLGSVGASAVLDDLCCNDLPDRYQPASIVLADLATGALSPLVALKPEPERHAIASRPLGQAFLEGNDLYVAVQHALYWYGDPRMLRTAPKRVADDLGGPPRPLPGGLIAAQVQNDEGVTAELIRLRGGVLDSVWSKRDAGFEYDPSVSPNVLVAEGGDAAGYRMFLRTDGRQLLASDSCPMVSSGPQLLMLKCEAPALDGDRSVQYLAAYRWPSERRWKSQRER